MILSDTCIVRKTDANACLGIDINDTLHTMIDKIAGKLCSISLDWTCLTAPSPSTTTLNLVLQELINNVKSNKLTFSSGFTVTPTSCGSVVSYAGSGLTLTSTAGSITTGSPSSSIILTPGSGTYNLQPSFANAARASVPANIVPGPTKINTSFSSFRDRWDGHVDFDGYINFTPLLINYLTMQAWIAATGSNGYSITFDLFTLPSIDVTPDRIKVFPAQFELVPVIIPSFPVGFCPYFNAQIQIQTFGGGSKFQLVIKDCKKLLDQIELFHATYNPDDYPLSAILWISQVQYYTA
jgi:hypothetical protein